MMIAELILDTLIFILPAYVANGSPVVISKVIKKRRPIDFGRNFIDGRRILGNGKSIEGFIGGISVGFITGLFLTAFNLHTITGSFLLSSGALIGDVFGSFIKRRIGIKRGEPFPFVDQLMFLLVAELFYCLFFKCNRLVVMMSIVLTPLIHLSTNYLAYKVKLKSVPW